MDLFCRIQASEVVSILYLSPVSVVLLKNFMLTIFCFITLGRCWKDNRILVITLHYITLQGPSGTLKVKRWKNK